MRKGLILPFLALALVAGACDDNDDNTGPNTQANVRFVNAISGVNGNLALTANGAMIGSALGFGSSATQCARVNSGSTSLAFGTANTGGTGISGTALETMTQNFSAGGNFTVIASGTAADPQFLVFNNTAASSIPNGQTAVRFVNLVPSLTGGASSTFNVFTGTTTTGTPLSSSVSFATQPTTFSNITPGSTTFSFTDASGNTIFTNDTGLNLTANTSNTVAILPNSAGTGFQLVNLTACS